MVSYDENNEGCMSVVIKGMCKSDSCIKCDFLAYDEYNECLFCRRSQKRIDVDIHSCIPEWCPIVGLPEHHGDLIDRNYLIKESLADGAYGYIDTKEIYDAPTIIEAE